MPQEDKTMLKKLSSFTLAATSGNETIAEAKKVFPNYIDSGFKDWNLDKKSKPTKKVELAVSALQKDATFKGIFTNPEKMCLTQSQIIEVVKSHSGALKNTSWANLFLFQENGEFFVADVYVYGGGGRHVYVHHFEDDGVWRAGDGYRVVVPQLALESSASPLTLSPKYDSLNLESRIDNLEKLVNKLVCWKETKI